MELHIVLPPRPQSRLISQLQQCFYETFNHLYPQIHFIESEQQIQQIPQDASVIIAGSPASVNEHSAWHEQMRHYILQQSYQKLVGICFGAQMIAQAFGGQVSLSPQGWNLGVHETQISDHWPANAPLRFHALFHHQEIITALPPQFSILATAHAVPISCFSDKKKIMGCQFHPEFDLPFHHALMQSQVGQIPAQLYQTASNSHKDFSHQYDRQLIIDFLQQPLPKIST